MPITTSTPYVDADGNEYPYFLVNLAVSPRVQGGEIGASVACRLTPYRVDADGNVVKAPNEASRALVYGDAYKAAETDPALANAVTNIWGAIQQLVAEKGV